MASSRFASLESSIQTFIEEQENQNTVKKTKRDVALFTEFLQKKGEARGEIAEIPPAELNELLSEFILSVRTKEGQVQDYEPSSLRGMVASFERHLKRKSYPVSIIHDLAFDRLIKTLHSKQKQLKKKGKGNRPHASVALRPSLPEDQAGVIHAISPFWMKLCQIEGTTQQL